MERTINIKVVLDIEPALPEGSPNAPDGRPEFVHVTSVEVDDKEVKNSGERFGPKNFTIYENEGWDLALSAGNH